MNVRKRPRLWRFQDVKRPQQDGEDVGASCGRRPRSYELVTCAPTQHDTGPAVHQTSTAEVGTRCARVSDSDTCGRQLTKMTGPRKSTGSACTTTFGNAGSVDQDAQSAIPVPIRPHVLRSTIKLFVVRRRRTETCGDPGKRRKARRPSDVLALLNRITGSAKRSGRRHATR